MFSYWAKPEHTLDLARYLNDDIAQTVAENRKRFVGKFSFPLALSLEEENDVRPSLNFRVSSCSREVGVAGACILQDWEHCLCKRPTWL